MISKQDLCSRCKTGAIWLRLDPLATECPFIARNNGKSCLKFKEMEDSKNSSAEQK